MKPELKLVTKKQAAAMLSCSTKTLERWVDEGILPAYRRGRFIRFKESDLVACIEKMAVRR